MLIGYTILDPLVVVVGSLYVFRMLSKAPLKALAFIPAALSLYFFIPTVTNLTLWQTVPLILLARMVFVTGLIVPNRISFLIYIFFAALFLSSAYGFVVGNDMVRTAIRLSYYLGCIALFFFSYEIGHKRRADEILLQGLVISGVVFAAYGVYQILAVYTGLPVRMIVYSASGSSIAAFENGIVRINSFANEPKRLGYFLMICGLACFFYIKYRPNLAKRLKRVGLAILVVSSFTFAGSYYLSVAICAVCLLCLFPFRLFKIGVPIFLVILTVASLFPDSGFVQSVTAGFERRADEVEVGIHGEHVYRQEFYAWDYLSNNPRDYFSGLGLGQYYSVLFKTYGIGVGFNERGGLAPLNSLFLELLFDLGGLVALLVYFSLAVLILRLRNERQYFLCLVVLFLTIQSFTILTLQFLALFVGFSLARLELLKKRALVARRYTHRKTAYSRLRPER